MRRTRRGHPREGTGWRCIMHFATAGSLLAHDYGGEIRHPRGALVRLRKARRAPWCGARGGGGEKEGEVGRKRGLAYMENCFIGDEFLCCI